MEMESTTSNSDVWPFFVYVRAAVSVLLFVSSPDLYALSKQMINNMQQKLMTTMKKMAYIQQTVNFMNII